MAVVPDCSFTIPSIEDETAIDCRLFTPFRASYFASSCPRQTRLAAVAHPYAPLGGSQDDGIVLLMVKEFTSRGYMVLTFNFRGAAQSEGTTSWTGKGERSDYLSVVGAGICFVTELDRLSKEADFKVALDNPIVNPDPELESGPARLDMPILPATGCSSLMSSNESSTQDSNPRITLSLAGYSYGSLIASLLPNISTVCETLAQPPMATPAAEIRLRARHLARKLHDHAQLRFQQPSKSKDIERRRKSNESPCIPSGIAIGGDESPRRPKSRDASRGRSIGTMRKSFEKTSTKLHIRTPKSPRYPTDEHLPPNRISTAATLPRLAFPQISPSFLLVSPIFPPLSSLLTGFTFSHPFSHFSPFFSSPSSSLTPPQQLENLRQHHTLAVFGTKDGFTSYKRFEKWAREVRRGCDDHERGRISNNNNNNGDGAAYSVEGEEEKKASGFQTIGIEGAGHFWREEGVVEKLREICGQWIAGLDT